MSCFTGIQQFYFSLKTQIENKNQICLLLKLISFCNFFIIVQTIYTLFLLLCIKKIIFCFHPTICNNKVFYNSLGLFISPFHSHLNRKLHFLIKIADDHNLLDTHYMVFRWSIMTFEKSISIPRKMSHAPNFSMAAYEDSVVHNLTKILQTDQHGEIISAAK